MAQMVPKLRSSPLGYNPLSLSVFLLALILLVIALVLLLPCVHLCCADQGPCGHCCKGISRLCG